MEREREIGDKLTIRYMENSLIVLLQKSNFSIFLYFVDDRKNWKK